MDRLKIYVASGIFLVLTAVKLLVPSTAVTIKAEATRLLGKEADLAPVIELVEDHLTLNKDEYGQTEVSPAPEPEETTALRPVAVGSDGELGDILGECAPVAEEIQLPEAVTAFLESQERFSAYALPSNVTYDYSLLPFDYSVPVAGYESSGFGYRVHPIYGDVRFHYGADLAAYTGEEVLAFTAGTVTTATYSDSYGYYVVIDHGDGWETLYAHCWTLLVSRGDEVEAGETIALVGDTGLATGPHLHFELTHDGVYLNPEYYINDQ